MILCATIHNTANEIKYTKSVPKRSMYAKICILEVKMNTRFYNIKIAKYAVFQRCLRRYQAVFETELVFLPNENITSESQQGTNEPCNYSAYVAVET